MLRRSLLQWARCTERANAVSQDLRIHAYRVFAKYLDAGKSRFHQRQRCTSPRGPGSERRGLTLIDLDNLRLSSYIVIFRSKQQTKDDTARDVPMPVELSRVGNA